MPAKAIISGIAGTAAGKLPGSSALSLQSEAAFAAIADAGLVPGDVDGVICAYTLTEPHLMLASWFTEYTGLTPDTCFAIQAGGATATVMVALAASLVESGQCRNILLVTGDNRLTGMSRDSAVAALADVGHPQFERPYGTSIPASYALVASRYMHEYGSTPDHLAGIAVSARTYAARNPKAQMRTLITVADVTSSKRIASPLRLLDCCLISDGAAAIVVSTDETARDLPNRAIEILGSGQAYPHEHIVAAQSLTEFGCAQSSKQAFATAGVHIGDIDIAEIYDSFTITLLVELESIGFFEKGEAGPAILDGALNIDGALPCNTHGGLLSYGHPGAAGGMYHVVEAVEQLRHTAGDRQAGQPELAFVHGDGGILSAHCSLILARG